MCDLAAQWTATWAEDTALLRSNRSADPGAKTEARAIHRSPGFSRFGIGPHAKNLRGTMPRSPDRMSPPQPTHHNRTEFHFPLNQDIRTSAFAIKHTQIAMKYLIGRSARKCIYRDNVVDAKKRV
jgi:hypothetical protein